MVNQAKLYLPANIRPSECQSPNPVLYNALATTLALKDPGLAEHSDHCARHALTMMEALRQKGHPAADQLEAAHFCQAMRLHDLGKIAIPDAILNKPGPLDPHELKQMKTHCLAGARALRTIQVENDLAEEPVLKLAAEVALSHHERWDGSGYPLGLGGTDIPIAGRIAILIDIYDSLCSPRVYKSALPHGRALAIMKDMASTTFDADLYEIFIDVSDILRVNRLTSASINSRLT